MKVCVLGAGVVGVASAYYLNRAGHEVTVIDRQGSAGLETSFANGGQVSACHAAPWAGPAVPWLMLKWLGRNDAPLLYRLRADRDQWRWSWQFLMNCRAAKAKSNTVTTMKLALYSRELMPGIRADTGIDYDLQTRGILDIYRNRKELDAAIAQAAIYRDLGCDNKILGAKACIALEPALEEKGDELVGGIHTPNDESGDAHTFTRKLALVAAHRGTEFRFGETITALEAEGDHITGVITDKGRLEADAYVVSMGSYGPLLLKKLGIRLPVYPTKGYSVTIPTGGHNGAPTISITDEDHKLVYSRLGDRLRVAGTAEITGYDTTLNEARARSILEKAKSQFSGAGDFDKATFWTGLRPLTPDGMPVIDRAKYANLFLNTGHGTLGWTLCAGSGKALADMVSGTEPDIELSGFTLDRF